MNNVALRTLILDRVPKLQTLLAGILHKNSILVVILTLLVEESLQMIIKELNGSIFLLDGETFTVGKFLEVFESIILGTLISVRHR